jgi:hypothetical protein
MPNEEEKKDAPTEEEPAKADSGCCGGAKEDEKADGCGCGCGCEEGACHCDENGTEVCESDCGCQCMGASAKKRKLVLVSAILAIIAGIVAFASAMSLFFESYSGDMGKAIGYGGASLTLLTAATLITFATFAILHLAKGTFRAKWLFPAITTALGATEVITDIIVMSYAGKMGYGSAEWARVSLLFILGLALLVAGILAFVFDHKCEKCGKIFFFVAVGLALFDLVLMLALYLPSYTITTLPFSAFLIENTLLIAVEILGLLIMVGEGQRTMKEDKEAAETLLAYQELLEKEVITEEEFEEKKEEILR